MLSQSSYAKRLGNVISEKLVNYNLELICSKMVYLIFARLLHEHISMKFYFNCLYILDQKIFHIRINTCESIYKTSFMLIPPKHSFLLARAMSFLSMCFRTSINKRVRFNKNY